MTVGTLLRRPVGALALAGALTIGLSGCVGGSTLGDGSKKGTVATMLNPEQARAEMIAFEDSIERLFPDATWSPTDAVLPYRCVAASGAEGAYFMGHRSRVDPTTDPRGDSETVIRFLEENGFTDIAVSSFAEGHHELTAHGPTGIYINHWTDGAVAGFSVDSACIEADFIEVSKRFEALLDAEQEGSASASPSSAPPLPE